ncbi:uncharacterized protein LOC143614115 [Bidens hawaiensis]|uniref:uncharacterized protein LOC143614115 n=1 Tax=Bidens hawaiensis TaxID=980011 RepID=UPI00404A4479
MQTPSSNKRVRSDSDELAVDSVEAKRILLDILDDSEVSTPSQDLDSFMKSFQDEISAVPESTESTQLPELTELAESTESRVELGFLLEASDDELGLPPSDENSVSSAVEKTTELGDSVGLSELWGLDDQISSYGSFDYEFGPFGYGDVSVISNYYNGEYVALDGLFDHTDIGLGSSELMWQPETLPAQ